MKVLIIGNPDRYEAYFPEDIAAVQSLEKVFVERGATDEEILAACPDADFISADAMTPVGRKAIEGMPNLKLIHSEGVGFNLYDLEAASERGIYVCNCSGVNAGAVAEQTILLMLSVLRNVVEGDKAVREARQIKMKEGIMATGLKELADCRIGLIGLGAIGAETAKRLKPFGAEVYYYTRHRKSPEEEAALGVSYLPREDLVKTCDMISLHVPVTPETGNMVDAAFLGSMRPDAFLINTARGDLVDHEALRSALENGRIAGAGLDTLYPEPVKEDNPLLQLSEEAAKKVVFSPHIGGITHSAFARAHRMIWQSFADVMEGKRPENIVNGL